MKKYIIRILALMIASGSTIFSCTYDEISPKVIEVPENVSFTVDVLPIFTNTCAQSGCHSANGIPPNLSVDNAYISLTFFGYVNINDPENSIIYQKITNGSMKTYADDQDRAIILKWIEQGALDN